MTEADLQRCITDAMDVFGWLWVHVRAGQTSRGWRVPISGPLGAGWPDLFAVKPRDRRSLFIECKADRGQVTGDQLRVHELLRLAGHEVWVVRPFDLDAVLAELSR